MQRPGSRNGILNARVHAIAVGRMFLSHWLRQGSCENRSLQGGQLCEQDAYLHSHRPQMGRTGSRELCAFCSTHRVAIRIPFARVAQTMQNTKGSWLRSMFCHGCALGCARVVSELCSRCAVGFLRSPRARLEHNQSTTRAQPEHNLDHNPEHNSVYANCVHSVAHTALHHVFHPPALRKTLRELCALCRARRVAIRIPPAQVAQNQLNTKGS